MSAPGVNVRSSIPGNAYLEGAALPYAPHVSGGRVSAIGLTRNDIAELRHTLTSTAFRPTTDTYPNNTYGWGRVDAWRAVLQTQTGVERCRRRCRRSHSLAVARRPSLPGYRPKQTDQTGTYRCCRRRDVHGDGNGFGYLTGPILVVLSPGLITRQDFALSPLPVGQVTGHITNLTGMRALTVELNVLHTPLTEIVSSTYR
jgi:hypothetical protein